MTQCIDDHGSTGAAKWRWWQDRISKSMQSRLRPPTMYLLLSIHRKTPSTKYVCCLCNEPPINSEEVVRLVRPQRNQLKYMGDGRGRYVWVKSKFNISKVCLENHTLIAEPLAVLLCCQAAGAAPGAQEDGTQGPDGQPIPGWGAIKEHLTIRFKCPLSANEDKTCIQASEYRRGTRVQPSVSLDSMERPKKYEYSCDTKMLFNLAVSSGVKCSTTQSKRCRSVLSE